MSLPAGSQDVGLDPATVVADQKLKSSHTVFQLDFDVMRPRVAKCVGQRLSSDTVDLVAKHRTKGSPLAFRDDSQISSLAGVLGVGIPLEAREGLLSGAAAKPWRRTR